MLTAIVLTHNSAHKLETCLGALSFCDHILVVDDNSTDATLEIAKSYTTEILTHPLNGNFAACRNWAMSHVKSGWILFIDADEIVSENLAAEISAKCLLPNAAYAAYFIRRIDHLWGKTLSHGDLLNAKFIRLAKFNSGLWHDPVHEYWQVTGATATLVNPLDHYPHDSVVSFLQKLNTYSSIRADQFKESDRKSNLFTIAFAPLYKFVHLYIFKYGFLDGTAGFTHAMLMAFYVFLVAAKSKS